MIIPSGETVVGVTVIAFGSVEGTFLKLPFSFAKELGTNLAAGLLAAAAAKLLVASFLAGGLITGLETDLVSFPFSSFLFSSVPLSPSGAFTTVPLFTLFTLFRLFRLFVSLYFPKIIK